MRDDRLSRLAAAGDSRAFETIYERHHQALYRYCYSIVGSPEDAADALQSTMASALRALVGERREIAIKPWLFRIAHNECISMLRKRRPTAVIDSALELEAPSHDPALRERLRELVSDMRELPEAQRGALIMRELSGLGYREVASALATTEPHARQLVYEARTTLHELAEGRSMECESARRSISGADGRVMRGRRIRSHLRSCEGCRMFDQLTRQRSRDLAAFAPPLPAALAAAVLHKALGGGSGGAAVAMSSGGGSGFGSVVAGKAVLSSAVAKVAVVAVATAAVGTGAAGVIHKSTRHSEREPVPTIAKPAPAKPSTAKPTAVPPTTVPAGKPPRSGRGGSHSDASPDAGATSPPAREQHPNNGASSLARGHSDAPAPVHHKPVTPKPAKPKNDPPRQSKQKSSNGHPAKPTHPAKPHSQPKPEKVKAPKQQTPAASAPPPPPQSQNGQQDPGAGNGDAEPGQRNGNGHQSSQSNPHG